MSISDIILTIAGVYNISNALLMQTTNVKSSIVFKVIPFFIGLSCLWAALVLPS